MSMNETLYNDAVALLRELIATPSFSREEDQTAGVICRFLGLHHIEHSRTGNNVFAYNRHFDAGKPSILLNSHHDTVKPARGYTLDPFTPVEREGRLYGLGSNDAGGPLVSLIAAFVHFHERTDLRYNIAIAATAEEEISGPNGVEALLAQPSFMDRFGDKGIDCAIVGEPTQMQMAVAERGLMVLDCTAKGRSGHAARNEGENAIDKAVRDIQKIGQLEFPNLSALLGPVKLSVTVIETENKAHNVVPSSCRFVIDARVNELYTFEEVLAVLGKELESEILPRSTRLKSTAIALYHPLIQAGMSLGKTYYGSPTTSDKALMNFPALKMGPGDSARSHTADEFIYLDEIRNGISDYITLLEKVVQ
jgi:acetylornithine deacetylase